MSSIRRRAGRRDGAGSPEMLSGQSFFSPRVRGVQGRFSGEFTGDMAGRPDRPCGDRPIGAGLLLCDARPVQDARHHDRWEAPLRSRRAEPPSAREPITLRAPAPPIPCRSPLSLSSPMRRSFSGKLVGKFRQPAVAARDARPGRAPPILPLILPRTGVRGRIRGEFTGYIGGLSDRPGGAMPTACHGRAPGAPPPG